MTNIARAVTALERIAGALETITRPTGWNLVISEPEIDELAVDATFEGFTEHIGNNTDFLQDDEFILPDPRTFDEGDIIPDDVTVVARPNNDELGWIAEQDPIESGFDFVEDPIGIRLPRDTSKGGWLESDFPLTEVQLEEDPKRTYSLSEASELLTQYGIDTGQRRLKDFLNTGICWTDHYNRPRPIAAEYLEIVKQDSPNRDAVVRITPEGIDELARVMNVAV